MRTDSFSIRPTSSEVAASPLTAPCRCSSAKPRIAVSGVRSSWLASATKRRNLFSLAVRAAKDSSIRESIALSEVTKRPTSVSGLASGRRADKSPAAIFSAVSSTATSGRNPTRITMREANPIKRRAIRPMKTKTTRKREAVSSTPDND